MTDVITSAETAKIDLIQKLWGQFVDQLKDTTKLIEEGMESKGIKSDDAFSIVTLMLLREVFWRETIERVIWQQRVGIANADDTDFDIMSRVEREYDAWNEEFSAVAQTGGSVSDDE